MILLDAVYINQSGGKVLLEYFIRNLHERGLISDFFFLFDSRLDSPCLETIDPDRQLRLVSSEGNRRRFYKQMPADISRVFCFANVPPPVKLRDRSVFILFHNALILSNKGMNYSLKTRLAFFLKKRYIKSKSVTSYRWIVQTRIMSGLLAKKLKVEPNAIKVLPFYEDRRFHQLNQGEAINRGQFLYVADGVSQKNHQVLLQAWELVFDQKRLPVTLHLTVPAGYEQLLAEIDRLKARGVPIINHGHCSFNELQRLYERCNFFINPSLTESFGLPLIEAAEAGCEIIAADLQYVYEIVKPLAIFAPHNAQNIAETIRDVYQGKYTGKTQIVVKNRIEDLINLIYNNV
jgi:glycosyltransferase involved in cell wall biosynthesis